MKTKIFTGLLGIASFVFAVNSAAASQIPAGYVLVPAETFFEGDVNYSTTPTKIEISANKSSLRANDEIGFVDENYSTITATLRDETGNPIVGQKVNLVSSRTTDTIRALQTTTNKNGEVIFHILANEEGVSSFTAVADNQTINERSRIVFLQKAGSINGNLLRADIATGDERINIDFPGQVVVNTPTDITVEVEDNEGSLIEDFAGTISFVSSDELAILPRDYTFTELDRGTHTFANAVTFITTGNQTIDIYDDTNTLPQKFSIEVLGSAGTLEAPIIASPLGGGLANKTIPLLGFAEANSNLAILVNGQFFAEGESDESGRFLFEIDLLDGQHEITVAILNSDGSISTTSEAIKIEMDQTPPVVENIQLDPGNKVVVDTLMKVNVKGEPELENVQLHIGEDFIKLEETKAGIYSGEFTVSASGAYFLNLELVDSAGNIGSYPEITSLLAVSATPAVTIIATGCDGKILLEWQSGKNENLEVANYRLDYGVESKNYVESQILPDGTTRSEWEVHDLINGVEYFFALRGIDDFGKAVTNLSEEVSAIPQAGKICPSAEEDVIQLWQREDADGNPILVWNPVAGATSYRVYAGTQPNIFDLPIVEVNSTSFRPEGLLANEDYYFAISAIYSNGHEAATLSNITKIEVGPAEILLISITLALTGSWLIRRRFAQNKTTA